MLAAFIMNTRLGKPITRKQALVLDLCNFTVISQEISPMELIKSINYIFSGIFSSVAVVDLRA